MRFPWIAALLALWICRTALAGLLAESVVEKLDKRAAAPQSLVSSGGVMTAEAKVRITTPIPADAGDVVVVARTGSDKVGLSVDFTWEDKAQATFTATAQGKKDAPDQYLQLMRSMDYYIRPNLQFYRPDSTHAIAAAWDKWPPASEHFLRVELRRVPNGSQMWVDGRFVKDYPEHGRVSQVVVTLAPGGAVKEINWGGAPDQSKYLVLTAEDFCRPTNWAQIMDAKHAWENAMAGAKVSVGGVPGAPACGSRVGDRAIGGVPFRVAPADRNIDVSGLGVLWTPSSDGVSYYWGRSTLDGLPEGCIVSIPLATYEFAHVLCAAEVKIGGVPEFNVRLTRYGGSRGNAFADTPVRLPAEGQSPADARQVGTVTYGPVHAQKTVPLWLVRVPLKNGLIQDIEREDETGYNSYRLPTKHYLDLELMEPMKGVDEYDAFPPPMHPSVEREFRPRERKTTVRVFGITLEKSPAKITVRPSTGISAFYVSDRPELRATVDAQAPGEYSVKYDFADPDGHIVAKGRKDVALTAGQPAETVSVPVTTDNGWYAARFQLFDASGLQLDDNRSTFVMLPPDTRKAGPESPHGAWWFSWAHGGAPDMERCGPMFLRAGLRHSNMPAGSNEASAAPYKMSQWCVYWNYGMLLKPGWTWNSRGPDPASKGKRVNFTVLHDGKTDHRFIDVDLKTLDKTASDVFEKFGITVGPVPPEMAKQLGCGTGAAVVTKVRQYSGANNAGWKAGWVIAQCSDTDIAGVDDLRSRILAYATGGTVAYEQYIRDSLAKWPNLSYIMIDHESGGYGVPLPSELWGVKAPPIEPGSHNDELWKLKMARVLPLCEMVRQKFPNLKIQFGNNGDGCAVVAEYLRRGLPPKYMDYVGAEDLCQTYLPERPRSGAMQSVWLLRQTARILGAPNVQANAAYEWDGRCNDILGLGVQAEWYARDALQARAYGFHTMDIGTIHDAGQGYYHSIWGRTGLCGRYPYMYPKPSYAALATLTRVLDCAEFTRTIPTESLATYAVEFRRGNQWIYGFWSARGRQECGVHLDSDADVTLTSLYGHETTQRARDLKLAFGTAAQYLTTTARITSIDLGKSSFPEDAPPAHVSVVGSLDNIADVELVATPDPRLEKRRAWENLPFLTKGRFEASIVNDPEKGRCIELKLDPVGKLPWALTNEYVFVKLKHPISVPGVSNYAGVWIKGNGGWGDFMWEMRNGRGGNWLTVGYWWDWPGELAINFQGWNFLRISLASTWKNPKERSGMEITGFAVTIPREALYVTEMAPAPKLMLRIKDLCFF